MELFEVSSKDGSGSLPVVLPGLVERAVGSQAAELLTDSREPQREQQDDHGQDEEEDDQQGGLDWVRL